MFEDLPPPERADHFTSIASNPRTSAVRRGHRGGPSRVAMLRALLSVRGFSRVPGTVDLAGRRGVAVGLVRFGVRTDLVFDQATFAFLGTRDVLANRDGDKPAGTVTETVQVRTQIVDRVGELPKG